MVMCWSGCGWMVSRGVAFLTTRTLVSLVKPKVRGRTLSARYGPGISGFPRHASAAVGSGSTLFSSEFARLVVVL